ncbi:carbon starvation CstA family protein [Desulfotomaculum copahuensis]|uniref:Carbon starvation protein CstA n=1 Tax=Desulfotomaculum copahuensis TaxID=1838280 RepID=A0A1B7LCU4_9FIRM|nr:carbon starvation protein A [Desulfotomaculum copahuensis]OAT80737.1 carbon starvation protein CstA [Desulfotomaculum copahuensis]
MNAIYLVICGVLFLVLAYRFYGAFIAARVLAIDASRETPAVRHNDNRDYVPTNKWIVLGHHFAAIAGAGPLIGPVLAAQFGYLPGTLWILLGGVLAGAVHDMVILFASVRYDGLSLAEIAKRELGNFSGVVTSIAVLLILIVAMAGLALAVVNALFNSSWGTFSVGVTIPIALLIGIYMKWLRPGRIAEATVIGVVLVVLGVLAGPAVQHSSWAHFLLFSRHEITVLMAVYGFVAAVLPVWLLLAPRDYLSTYMKIGIMILLALGVIIVHPVLQMPAVTNFIHGHGPIIPGKVWPYLFITIACGAISGFHSLVSSGTTPKMISSEKDILPIGYGGMLMECFVALIALIAATSMAPADYFAINVMPAAFAKLGMHVKDLPVLSQMVGENVAGRPGGAVSLAVGMAHIFGRIPGLGHLMSYLYHFAILFEALFILTTIDAGTRVGRYLLQEIGGVFYRPLKNTNWWPGALVTSALMSFAWGYLVYNGTISTIWPLFGQANQLLSAIALAVGTTFLLHLGKAKYAWITAVPMVFMAVTTISAGYLNIVSSYLPQHNVLLAVISAVTILLALAIIIDSLIKWFIFFSGSHSDEINKIM